jgi:hypothetical protein
MQYRTQSHLRNVDPTIKTFLCCQKMAAQTSRDVTRRRTILGSIGILFILLAAYVWFFGAQTMCIVEAHYLAEKNPVVRQAPSELADSSTASSPKVKLSYFGYDFQVPWSDIDKAAAKIHKNMAIVAFKSGLRLVFTVAPQKSSSTLFFHPEKSTVALFSSSMEMQFSRITL